MGWPPQSSSPARTSRRLLGSSGKLRRLLQVTLPCVALDAMTHPNLHIVPTHCPFFAPEVDPRKNVRANYGKLVRQNSHGLKSRAPPGPRGQSAPNPLVAAADQTPGSLPGELRELHSKLAKLASAWPNEQETHGERKTSLRLLCFGQAQAAQGSATTGGNIRASHWKRTYFIWLWVKQVPNMEPWYMDTWTKTCGPLLASC